MNKKTEGLKSLSGSLRRLMIGIIILVIAAFVVSIFFIGDRERREYEISESEGVLRTLTGSIESAMTNYMEVSRLIITDDRLVTFLRADADKVDMGMINDARFGVLDILYVTGGVDSVAVFRDDMIMMSTDRTTYEYDHDLIESDKWREDILAAKGRAVVSLNGNGALRRKDAKPVITIAREINDVLTQKRRGILLMNISADVFDSMLQKLEGNEICLAGTDGTYIAGNKDILEFYPNDYNGTDILHVSGETSNGPMLTSVCRVGSLPVVLIRRSSFGTEGIPYSLMYVLLFLMLFLVLSVFYVGTFVARSLTRPVFKLSETMKKNKQAGKLEQIDIPMRYSELDLLKEGYNDMIIHVDDLITELMDKEKSLREAEMRVLLEQIKPHFLYNSIETIGYLALDAGAENVHGALETLGSFYRNFLSKGGAQIPLSREIQIVKDYLSLQKLRYGDIIKDEYDIAENTEGFIVPKLILQPLVENSIYHGIRMKGEPGIIRITSTKDKGELHIKVEDTGIGMPQEKIDELMRHEGKDDPSASFGLWDTITRIRKYCGRDDVVRISSELGEYTRIELVISDSETERV